MHLVQVLAAGVNGAGNGTAQLFRRGTSTRAPWYEDFEASAGSLNADGADIELDSNGGAIVYVAELVTVIVKDSSGTTVRTFVAGDRDDAVEVQSPAFTGTHYDTAQVAANNPTTLATVLDLWKEKSGSIDWEVDVAGISTTIQDAVAAASIFVNVQSPQFGAVGDGVTDDTSAINAAIVQAAAIGNATVYFPPGEYIISDTIDVLSGVNLLGTHTGAVSIFSSIKRSDSDFSFLTFEDVSQSESRVDFLGFQDAETGANAAFFVVPDSVTVTMTGIDCQTPLGAGVNGSPIFDDPCGSLDLFRCSFLMKGGPAVGMFAQRTGASLTNQIKMVNCRLTWGDGVAHTGTEEINGVMRISACRFMVSASSANKPSIILKPSSLSVITGCEFDSTLTSPDTVQAILADGAAGFATVVNGVVESGNTLASIYRLTGTAGGKMSCYSNSMRRQTLTIAAPGTLNIDPSLGGAIAVTTTGAAGAYVMALGTVVSETQEIELIIRNTTANAHTLDTSGTSPVDTVVPLAANQIARVRYKRLTVGVTTTWWRMTAFTVTAL